VPRQSAREQRARVSWALVAGCIPEVTIAKLGIHTVAELNAAMARNPKGPILLSALLDFFTDAGAGLRIDDHIVELLAEPALTALHLATAATVMHRRGGPAYARLAVAICCHRLASSSAIIGAMWDAPPSLRQDIARARGDLLPVATGWVRRTDGDETGYANVRELAAGLKGALIMDTADLWARWAGTDPGRTAFLIASSGAFDTCEQLLAAGAGVTAAPART